MKIKKVRLPVVGEAGRIKEEWFDASDILAVEGQDWMPWCKIRISDKWRLVAAPVKEVMERWQ